MWSSEHLMTASGTFLMVRVLIQVGWMTSGSILAVTPGIQVETEVER